MDELSKLQMEGHGEDDDDFTVLWKKVFAEGQLQDARQRLTFSVTLQALEDVLTSIQVATGGQLAYSADVGFSRTRFTLETSTGEKGIDVMITDGMPGVTGWAYYQCPTFQQREAWRMLGNKWIKRLIDCKLDVRAAELLISEQGRDAFADTDLTLSLDGQRLDDYILNIVVRNDEKFRQAVQEVLNAHRAIAIPMPSATAAMAVAKLPNNAPPDEEAETKLAYTEQRIKDTYDLIVAEGQLHPTDETIAARLPLGPKGQPYTRETVNRYRNKMRKRGIGV